MRIYVIKRGSAFSTYYPYPAVIQMSMDRSPKLPFPEYQFWYDAIRTDDFDIIKKELNTTDINKKDALVNGTFVFDRSFDKKESIRRLSTAFV